MTGSQAAAVLLRIEKGQPEADELAALVAVLSTGRATAAAAEPAGCSPPPAPWRTPDQAPHFDPPRTWQAAAIELGGQVTPQHFAV
ncbi:MAG TPA: acyl-CoA carboxylase subunit epsilon [Jatrophihabitans sp.]|jgi:hypothetical protein|uniref:acyl-CoA carboxylase subunit epsilon n=1 Tax=Jatrophihabitans sp. TaxID=1932789 RepID=UPI002F224A1C